MLFLTKYERNLIVHGFCSPSHYNGRWGKGGGIAGGKGRDERLNMKIYQNFVLTKFSLHLWQDKPLWVELKMGRNIYYYITTLSLFHFFRNNQHSEKWSVSFRNFFRKCECISCYLPISSNLQYTLL